MLLRDVIDIPTDVRQGDLVFKLTDATEHTAETLAQYVVTDQLRAAFLEATKLVGAAVTEHRSKAAFLTGSFGAGKSNFMGVLQLLLDGNPAALAVPELAPVVAQIGTWRGDRRFLTVPFHLIGATSLESAVLGGYVDWVRAHLPDAPLPDVFADEPLLVNADSLRATMGDESFLAALGGAGGSGGDGWGDLSGGWTAARYEAARAEPAGHAERRLLVQALIADGGLLSGLADAARATRDGYVDIDAGLAAVSRHAHDQGYAGVILFLDELILWLMSRMADPAFVSAEASKISKLVEASEASRPAPIVSVIARQRDLRELIGSDVPGVERLAFVDQLNFQAGRFANVRLDDSNLPQVAHRRLLQPVDDAGAAALAEAFASLGLTGDERDALRGPTGTDEDFALTYPFSPAFLTVVVDVAGALQRTRTGLRVLLDLLVRNRDTFEVGQLVPVGDLWDVLDESDEPLSDAMKDRFDAARHLYRATLRPLLVADHGHVEGEPPTDAFRNDDRLMKTLLLASLVPNSAPFADLTARKLVVLNHGLIATPVPGTEVSVVVNKLKAWAARTGDLQLGTDPHNPTVHLVLSEVDTRTILDAASGVDNAGSRRNLVRAMLAEELGVTPGQLLESTSLVWRGVARPVELQFGNVRDPEDVRDAAFAPSGDGWKVVVDFPFDDDGHSPLEDLARVEALCQAGGRLRTVCWIPSFFTPEVRILLGDLVRLDHLLPVPGQTSERFVDATRHLSPENREAARPQLEAQQRAARSRLQHALRLAYGLGSPDPAVVDTAHGLADHYPSLLAGFRVAPPVASSLRDAFDQVVTQALEHTYPGAPAIDVEVRPADLRTVHARCTEALELPGRRIPQVPTADRKVMLAVANPLRLGVQSDQAFVLDVAPHWGPLFTRRLAEHEAAGASPATVGDLRRWLDEPRPMGLSTGLANLVLLVWAAATDHTFTDHGGPAEATVAHLPDHFEVVAEDLPDPAVWAEAVSRAEHALGVAGLPPTPSAVGLHRLSTVLATTAHDDGPAADALVGHLRALAGLVDGEPARLRTAETAAALTADLGRADRDRERVEAFAAADLSPSPEAVGASLTSSAGSVGAVEAVDTQILSAAVTRPDGAAVRDGLAALLDADELAQPLAPGLRQLYAQARDLVVGSAASGPATPGGGPPPGQADRSGPPFSGGGVAGGGPAVAAAAGQQVVAALHGLDRERAGQELDRLRRLLADGSLAGDRFDIVVTRVDGAPEPGGGRR